MGEHLARRISAALGIWVLAGGGACSSGRLQGDPPRGNETGALPDGGTIVGGGTAGDGGIVVDGGNVADGGSATDAITVTGHGDGGLGSERRDAGRRLHRRPAGSRRCSLSPKGRCPRRRLIAPAACWAATTSGPSACPADGRRVAALTTSGVVLVLDSRTLARLAVLARATAAPTPRSPCRATVRLSPPGPTPTVRWTSGASPTTPWSAPSTSAAPADAWWRACAIRPTEPRVATVAGIPSIVVVDRRDRRDAHPAGQPTRHRALLHRWRSQARVCGRGQLGAGHRQYPRRPHRHRTGAVADAGPARRHRRRGPAGGERGRQHGPGLRPRRAVRVGCQPRRARAWCRVPDWTGDTFASRSGSAPMAPRLQLRFRARRGEVPATKDLRRRRGRRVSDRR